MPAFRLTTRFSSCSCCHTLSVCVIIALAYHGDCVGVSELSRSQSKRRESPGVRGSQWLDKLYLPLLVQPLSLSNLIYCYCNRRDNNVLHKPSIPFVISVWNVGLSTSRPVSLAHSGLSLAAAGGLACAFLLSAPETRSQATHSPECF
jgi:hypothetical protein